MVITRNKYGRKFFLFSAALHGILQTVHSHIGTTCVAVSAKCGRNQMRQFYKFAHAQLIPMHDLVISYTI